MTGVGKELLGQLKTKVAHSVSESVTRSPIELSWTAKNIPKQFLADTNKQFTDKIAQKTLPKELTNYFSATSITCCL